MTAIAVVGRRRRPAVGLDPGPHGRRGGLRGLASGSTCSKGCPRWSSGWSVLRYLDDGPQTAAVADAGRSARWCSGASPRTRNGSRPTAPPPIASPTPSDRVASGRAAPIYFGAVMGIYGVTFWLPQIISETISRDPLTIGLVSTIPWGVAAVTMVLVGRHSDRHRRAPVAHRDPGRVGAVFFLLSGLPGSVGLGRRGLFDRGHRGGDVRRVELLGAADGGSCQAAPPPRASPGSTRSAISPATSARSCWARFATPRGTRRIPNGNMLLALSVLAVSLLAAGVIVLALPTARGLQAPGSRPQACSSGFDL